MECLKYYVENTSVKNEANGGNGTLREGICIDIATASRGGILREKAALNIFKYLVENGFVFDKPCYFHFMSREIGSDLCLLKYIHEEMNCEWDEALCKALPQDSIACNGNFTRSKCLGPECVWDPQEDAIPTTNLDSTAITCATHARQIADDSKDIPVPDGGAEPSGEWCTRARHSKSTYE